MTKTIVITLTVLIALVAVTPAYADGGEVKPVCTSEHTMFDRLFGNCQISTDEVLDTAISVSEDMPTQEKDTCMGIQAWLGLCVESKQ